MFALTSQLSSSIVSSVNRWPVHAGLAGGSSFATSAPLAVAASIGIVLAAYGARILAAKLAVASGGCRAAIDGDGTGWP